MNSSTDSAPSDGANNRCALTPSEPSPARHGACKKRASAAPHSLLRNQAGEGLGNPSLRTIVAQGAPSIKAPTPFLKWAGGKTQLLGQFARMIPEKFDGYAEPFAGSAALFFWLRRQRGSFPAALIDRNEELVNSYAVVRDHVDSLIPILEKLQARHGKRHYYSVRRQRPESLSEMERAARLIYLNKTCFNGLYRINSRGQFNVPIGSYKNPRIYDETSLRAASAALCR